VIALMQNQRPVIDGPAEDGGLSAEGQLLLIFAMLESIAADLATMQRRGLWVHDPAEAWAHKAKLTHVEWMALREWEGTLVDELTAMARAASNGKVAAGRALVRRWIRHLVGTREMLVRKVDRVMTPEQREARRIKRAEYAKRYQREYWERVKSARALGLPVRKIGRPRKEVAA
jgi:hypothetical protein